MIEQMAKEARTLLAGLNIGFAEFVPWKNGTGFEITTGPRKGEKFTNIKLLRAAVVPPKPKAEPKPKAAAKPAAQAAKSKPVAQAAKAQAEARQAAVGADARVAAETGKNPFGPAGESKVEKAAAAA